MKISTRLHRYVQILTLLFIAWVKSGQDHTRKDLLLALRPSAGPFFMLLLVHIHKSVTRQSKEKDFSF